MNKFTIEIPDRFYKPVRSKGQAPFSIGQHPISFSSSGDVPPGGKVSFTIMQLGDWSREQVPAVQPSDKMWLDGPHGVLSSDREQGMGYVLIAGGIGITPLYSMCQTIAHCLATIRDSTKIMVLNGGEIVEYASHDELMADKGFYYALYMSQFKGKAPAGSDAVDIDFIST